MAVQPQQMASNIPQLSDWRQRLRQLIASGGRNVFSAVESASPVQDAHSQPRIANAGAINALLQVNAYYGPSMEQRPSMEQQQVQHSSFTGNDIELLAFLGARKRAREGCELPPAQRHKASSILDANVLPNQANIPEATGGSYSDGLSLDCNDESLKTNMSPAKIQHEVSVLNVRTGSQMLQQKDEIDRCIDLQAKRMKEVLEEQRLRQFTKLFALVEGSVSKKFREKDAKAVKIARRNLELEDRAKQLSMEALLWQSKAKTNETMVSVLRTNLQLAEAQCKELMGRFEGCGDNEPAADDAASSNCGNNGDYHVQILQENKELKEQRSCRVCRSEEICMLLLPCRHLCLCKTCEEKLDFCPLCRCSKSASVQIYMP